MAYATQADITELYGADSLFVADRDGDGVVDAPAVTRALVSASDEIDSYIGVRVTLPLATVPGILRQLAVDIAVYRLALSRDVRSEEHRLRYEDALRFLKAVAKGEAVLAFTGDGAGEGDPDAPPVLGTVIVSGEERLFTRRTLRDF